MTTDLLTTSQVAELAGCHVRTVHRAVASGRIEPTVKLPGKVGAYLFTADAVALLAPVEPEGDAA